MTSRKALIGHTGFVGSLLAETMSFSDFYNSKNCEDMRGQTFDTVVCAGISAVKWKANKDPEQDLAAIEVLRSALDQVTARKFILISTVDVFGDPRGADETTPVETNGLHPYGLHRYAFEEFIRAKFPESCILRLPALFGPNLRKNVLFDLLHDNNLDQIPRRGIFQWYDLRRLPQDLEKAADLPLVHLMPEPLETQRIIQELFPDKADAGHENPAAHYDTRTIHAARFGGKGSYIATAEDVFAAMKSWAAATRADLAQQKEKVA